MDANRREVALSQQLVEFRGSADGLDKDDDLVEFERIEEIVELSILFSLGETDKVLLKTVQSELGFVVYVDFKWVLHELLASGPDLLGQGGREHHDLLVVRSSSEDLLDVSSHVNLLEHLVTLVEYKVLDTARLDTLVSDQGVQPTRSTDNDVRALRLVLENGLVVGDGCTTVEDGGSNFGHVLGESSVFVLDLEGKLSSVAEHDDGSLSIDWLDLLKRSQYEDGSLTHTRLGLTDDVHTEDRLRDTFLLNCQGSGVHGSG